MALILNWLKLFLANLKGKRYIKPWFFINFASAIGSKPRWDGENANEVFR